MANAFYSVYMSCNLTNLKNEKQNKESVEFKKDNGMFFVTVFHAKYQTILSLVGNMGFITRLNYKSI